MEEIINHIKLTRLIEVIDSDPFILFLIILTQCLKELHTNEFSARVLWSQASSDTYLEYWSISKK